MPKKTNDMATLDNYTKYEPKGAPVKRHGGNKAIHDGVVTHENPTAPLKAGSYQKGKGLMGEGAE